MRQQNYDFEWIQVEDGTFDCRVISMTLSAIRESTNGRKTFYNQVLAAYTGWIDKRNVKGEAVQFKDGSKIPQNFIDHLEMFMSENACVYNWTSGQFVIVDNSVAYHSR